MNKFCLIAFLALANGQGCPREDDPAGPYVDPALMGGRYGLERLISPEAFDQMFKGTSTEAGCLEGYTRLSYEGLVLAARNFPKFCNNGDVNLDRLELASFLAHCAHETTGGWATAPCGQSYGLCFPAEQGCESTGPDACVYPGTCDPAAFPFPECDPRPGKKYYGRGPIQLSYSYNYAQFSYDLYGDHTVLLEDPDKVLRDPVLLWSTAIWFWMKDQPPKESCHAAFQANHDLPGSVGGFGLTTMIINGGVECSFANCQQDDKELDRVHNLKRFSFFLGVPICAQANHSISCQPVHSYPFDSSSQAPCPLDPECASSNFENCFQLDGSTTIPAHGKPNSSCSFMGEKGVAHTPSTRTKADCTLPLIPWKTDSDYKAPTGPQFHCQEAYDPNETDPPSTSTPAPGPQPTQSPDPSTDPTTSSTITPSGDDSSSSTVIPPQPSPEPAPDMGRHTIAASVAGVAVASLVTVIATWTV